MNAFRYVTLDPTATLCVLLFGAGVVIALRVAETWSDRRAEERTRRALQDLDRTPDLRE